MTYQSNGYVPRVGYTQQFAAGAAPLVFDWSDLTHYWELDEGAGSSRVDEIGTADFLEISGTVPNVAGLEGNAADIQSAGNWLDVSLPSDESWNDGDFTYAGWVRVTATGRLGLPTFRSSGPAQEQARVDNTATQLSLNHWNASGGAIGTETITAPVSLLNVWLLVTARWSLSAFTLTWRVYGADITPSNVVSDSMVSAPTDPVQIRLARAIDFLTSPAQFDEIAWFNVSKSDEYLDALFNSGAGKFYPEV